MTPAVLLIDDEAEFTATLRKLLVRRGYDVSVADRGADGLALALARRFDVVLLDVKMPGLDGIEVLARLREARCGVPVILLTGHVAPDEQDRGLAAGAFAYLLKPYPTERLIETIEAARAAASRP